MATKSPIKIMDVKNPAKTAPETSARPLLVTNRPVISHDPMMSPASEAVPTDTAKPAPESVVHGGKTITPISDTVTESVEVAENKPADPEPETTENSALEPIQTEPTQPEAPIFKSVGQGIRDAEAEQNEQEAAALEAENTRSQELERLIADGTYAVSINAHRKRGKLFYAIVSLIICVIVLVVVLDVLLDMGSLSLSVHIPHTHFL